MCLFFYVKIIIPVCRLNQLTLPSILINLWSVSRSTFMENQRRPSPLTLLRKIENKLTYVGMLIATMQEKRKQGGLAPVFHLLEYCAYSMVLTETGHDRYVRVWGRLTWIPSKG